MGFWLSSWGLIDTGAVLLVLLVAVAFLTRRQRRN